MKKIYLPIRERDILSLKTGEMVLLRGPLFTARDAAHLRLSQLIKEGRHLPIGLNGATLYYTGPTPAARGRVIGSCGPTTSGRMDRFTPLLLSNGLRAMIGKGRRSAAVRASIKRHKAVYFITTGGAGALLSGKVKSAEVVAFKGLGAEAVYRLEVEDFPAIVGIDARGNDIYERRRKR